MYVQLSIYLNWRVSRRRGRDWEQGRAEPDQPTRAYLTLIARDPDHVNRTLNPKSA